jgi:hypothetical protein
MGVPADRTVSPATRNFMRYVRRYVGALSGGEEFRQDI